MTEHSYEQIDNLFTQVRLRLIEIRQSDPAAVEDLKSLVHQLEDCVEQLVIDSLKLRSLEGRADKATQPKKRPRKKRHPVSDAPSGQSPETPNV